METSSIVYQRMGWDDYFLEIAAVVAKRATCPRLKVGAVVTRNNKIVATGYNGASPGESHCTEKGCVIVNNHCRRVIHAESNALHQLNHHLLSSDMKIYITHKPCELCSEKIKKYGIKEIIWGHDYNGIT